MATDKPRILRAIDELNGFNRRGAAALLQEELVANDCTGMRWRSVAKLAAKIGEIDTAVEASRRYAASAPEDLEAQLYHWGELATHGRHSTALAILRSLTPGKRNHPGLLHFEGTLAAQDGDFDQAATLFRRALKLAPLAPQTWFALAMIKKFEPGDTELATMEHLAPQMAQAEPSIRGRFLYAIGKARHDCSDYDRAFEFYSKGAALRRQEETFDAAALQSFVSGLIRDFKPEAMRRLRSSGSGGDRAIFVNGVPRSGTTLVEQILASHSEVHGGAELNLLASALIPAADCTFTGALAYQDRAGDSDCWGELGRDYLSMLTQRFGGAGRLVDKTLCQSHIMGLLLHTLPDAKIVWLRRTPEDSAISTFRTYFTAPTPWSWSLEDIGAFYREEDRLYQHWTDIAGERILTVRYEELVSNPEKIIAGILDHVGLKLEPGVIEPHKAKRSVRTASVQQVREPISTARIGAASAYAGPIEAFRRAYHQH